jgi:hypothetical protein
MAATKAARTLGIGAVCVLCFGPEGRLELSRWRKPPVSSKTCHAPEGRGNRVIDPFNYPRTGAIGRSAAPVGAVSLGRDFSGGCRPPAKSLLKYWGRMGVSRGMGVPPMEQRTTGRMPVPLKCGAKRYFSRSGSPGLSNGRSLVPDAKWSSSQQGKLTLSGFHATRPLAMHL